MQRREFMKICSIAGGLSAVSLQAAIVQAATTIDHATTDAASSKSRHAFRELLEMLRVVEENYLGPKRRIFRPEDIADGERFIMHVLETGLHFWMEADPERPVFKPYVTPTRKLLGDNPDSLYFFAPIRGDRSYRIRGNIAGATFSSFTVEGGSSEGEHGTGSISVIDDTTMEIDAKGNYEIIVSAKEHKGNWLALASDAGQITTRHYFERKRCIAADPNVKLHLTIEPLDPPADLPVTNDASIAHAIHRVTNFVKSMTIGQPSPDDQDSRPTWVSVVPNRFNKPGKYLSGAYGNLKADYAMAPYFLNPDEGLIIEGRFPRCRFANVVLWNRFMQTYDYINRRVSLNRKQITLEPDGSFRIVIAHRNPGIPNWLDTEGRPAGLIYWRFVLPEEDVETPKAETLPFEKLAQA
jgi:hypothetical protein